MSQVSFFTFALKAAAAVLLLSAVFQASKCMRNYSCVTGLIMPALQKGIKGASLLEKEDYLQI
jgi:hypothetical protein